MTPRSGLPACMRPRRHCHVSLHSGTLRHSCLTSLYTVRCNAQRVLIAFNIYTMKQSVSHYSTPVPTLPSTCPPPNPRTDRGNSTTCATSTLQRPRPYPLSLPTTLSTPRRLFKAPLLSPSPPLGPHALTPCPQHLSRRPTAALSFGPPAVTSCPPSTRAPFSLPHS